MGTALLVTLIGAVIVAAFAGLGAVAIRSSYRRKQQVVPGRESAAPLEWVGSHATEAKLHRRLVHALADLRSVAGSNDLVADNIAVLENEGARVEQQLVAASQLADRLKGPALDELASAVTQIEDVAAQLMQRSSKLSTADAQSQVDALAERLELLAEARAELEDPRPEVG